MTSAQTVLIGISVLVGLAGALGVAYTVFRSASEVKLRELDKRIIDNQNELLKQAETETAKERQLRIAAELSANTYRESLTQKAAVDHLSEVILREEQLRHEEHRRQDERHENIIMLIKDVVVALKHEAGG